MTELVQIPTRARSSAHARLSIAPFEVSKKTASLDPSPTLLNCNLAARPRQSTSGIMTALNQSTLLINYCRSTRQLHQNLE